MSDNVERPTNGFERRFLSIPKRMVTTIVATLGFVLLIIGANLPSVILSGIGIAILVIILVLYVVRIRHMNDTDNVDSNAATTKLTEEYERDLKDTLDGYNLQGKYDNTDINKSTSEYLSSIGRTTTNVNN